MIAYTRRDFNELENRGTVEGTGPLRTAPNPQDGRSDAVLAKLVWDNGPHRIRLTGEWLDAEVETEVLTGLGPAFTFGPRPVWTVDALSARDTNSRVRASLDWTYDGSPDQLIEYAFLSAFWQDAEDRQFAFEERTTLTATPAPDRERLNTFENRVYGAAGEARSSFDLAGMTHRIAIGGDVSWTRQEGLRDGTFPGRGESFPTRAFPVTDFTLGGVFIADETQDRLLTTFVPQGQSGSRLSPKFGATVNLAKDVIIFGNYAQGFLAPTPSQVNNFFEFIAGGYTSIPNPDLRPETSESFEVGARYVGDIFSLQITGFSGDYDNFINQQVVRGGFTPQNPAIFQFVNFDGARIDGLEARAEMKLDNGFNARFAMAYANGDTIDRAGLRTPLDTIDPFNLVAGLGYRAPSGRFGGELILTHNARKEKGELERNANGSDLFVRPDASTILDLTAFYAVTDALKLRAGLFNLTNETYALWSDVRGLRTNDAAIFDAFTRPGRNLSVSASYRF
jgi:hemoglobin/transferrin/lactoferrin receptor protein